MRFIRNWTVAIALMFLCKVASGAEPYHFLNEIKIGGEGGWDILTFDSAIAARLYLSHATKVVVVDLANKNAVAGELRSPTRPAFTALSLSRNFCAGFRPTAKKTKRAWLT